MNEFIKADLDAALSSLAQVRSRAERIVAQAEERAARAAAMPEPPHDFDAGEVDAAKADRDFLKGLVSHVEAECATRTA